MNTILQVISNIMQWFATAIQRILCVLWYYPKLWICTWWIRRKIKKEGTATILDVGKTQQIIHKAVKAGLQCRIELTDTAYALPKKEWIQYIANNMWTSYKKIKQLMYSANHDCDNYAVGFFNMVQELMLGLCVGIAHYGFTRNGNYSMHAVVCYIPEEVQQLWLLEPQSDGFDTRILDLNKEDLFFVYLEGIQRF